MIRADSDRLSRFRCASLSRSVPLHALIARDFNAVKAAICFSRDIFDNTDFNAKVGSEEGYSRKTLWVAKEDFTIRRALYYDLKGRLLKELKATGIKLLDPAKKRYRTMRMEMHNHQNGRRSIFDSKQVAFVPTTKDEYFTTRFLERQ